MLGFVPKRFQGLPSGTASLFATARGIDGATALSKFIIVAGRLHSLILSDTYDLSTKNLLPHRSQACRSGSPATITTFWSPSLTRRPIWMRIPLRSWATFVGGSGSWVQKIRTLSLLAEMSGASTPGGAKTNPGQIVQAHQPGPDPAFGFSPVCRLGPVL
jgi:hypothetical protein